MEPMFQVLFQHLKRFRAGAVACVVNGGESAQLLRCMVQVFNVCGCFRLSEMKASYQNIRAEVGYYVQDATVGAAAE